MIFLSDKLAVFISCSHESNNPSFPFLHNIHVGAAQSKKIFNDMIGDNFGDNISEKNPYYCELTSQYYAWKNCDAQYMGFFHSRRYISFNQKYLIDKNFSKRRFPRPYTVEKFPTVSLLQKYGYDKSLIHEIVERHPVIGVLPERMSETSKERFIRTQKNGKRELELIEKKLKTSYPEFLPAFEKYMLSKYLYFCNMFIMRRDIFDSYCGWLFDILAYVDENLPERLERDDGMMGEQLFGIYMTYIKEQNKLNWAELPRIHFSEVGGTTKNFSCNRLGNLLFPPGTLRRNILRKVMKG